VLLPFCSCVVCFCCVRFSFFSSMPRGWLERMSLKWLILGRVGRKTLTQSINWIEFGCWGDQCIEHAGQSLQSSVASFENVFRSSFIFVLSLFVYAVKCLWLCWKTLSPLRQRRRLKDTKMNTKTSATVTFHVSSKNSSSTGIDRQSEVKVKWKHWWWISHRQREALFCAFFTFFLCHA